MDRPDTLHKSIVLKKYQKKSGEQKKYVSKQVSVAFKL